MAEKRALNTAMISLALYGVIVNMQILLATFGCEEISCEISQRGIGGFVSDPRIFLPMTAAALVGLVFAAAAGIFLAECYRRSFPAMAKGAAYLIAFGSLAAPVPFTFTIALGIPCFRSAKKSTKWLWLAYMLLTVALPVATASVSNAVRSHLLFYDLVGVYLLMLFVLDSLAAEKVGRGVRGTVIGLSALSVAIWGVIVGSELRLRMQLAGMEASFRAAGIPVCRAEFDRYLAEGKIDNADTAKFSAVLEKIRKRSENGKDFSEFIPELEKYSATDHLLGKANFGLPLQDRLYPHFQTLRRVSEYYDRKMNEAENADELIRTYLLSNRLNKFFFENDFALLRLLRTMKERLDAFAKNARRFSFTEAQKSVVLAELRRLETEQHLLFSRAGRYFPMILLDAVDFVAGDERTESHGNAFFRMHPVTGAPCRVFALKAKLHGRGYAELIARKYDLHRDFDQLPKEKFLPDESVYETNALAALAINDKHEMRILGMKYEMIAKIRALASEFSGGGK